MTQIQKLPAAVLDWRPFSRCSKQLSSALHHSVDSLLRSSSSLVNNNWDVGLSLENYGNAVLGGSRSDLAKFARSQHSVDKATFAIHEISCTYYRYGYGGGGHNGVLPGTVHAQKHFGFFFFFLFVAATDWLITPS